MHYNVVACTLDVGHVLSVPAGHGPEPTHKTIGVDHPKILTLDMHIYNVLWNETVDQGPLITIHNKKKLPFLVHNKWYLGPNRVSFSYIDLLSVSLNLIS